MARQSLTEAKRFSIVPSGNFSNPTILSPPPLRRFSARAASNLVPIHRLYHPPPPPHISSSRLPRPTSALGHRPSSSPFRSGAPARGNGARRRRGAGGVAPTSSANRPTVSTERSPLGQASIKPGAVERVDPLVLLHETHDTNDASSDAPRRSLPTSVVATSSGGAQRWCAAELTARVG